MKKKENIEYILQKLNLHSKKFGYHYIPDREIIIDTEKAKELTELIDKSLKEGMDYLPEHYNIDVEKHKEPTPKIIYD